MRSSVSRPLVEQALELLGLDRLEKGWAIADVRGCAAGPTHAESRLNRDRIGGRSSQSRVIRLPALPSGRRCRSEEGRIARPDRRQRRGHGRRREWCGELLEQQAEEKARVLVVLDRRRCEAAAWRRGRGRGGGLIARLQSRGSSIGRSRPRCARRSRRPASRGASIVALAIEGRGRGRRTRSSPTAPCAKASKIAASARWRCDAVIGDDQDEGRRRCSTRPDPPHSE